MPMQAGEAPPEPAKEESGEMPAVFLSKESLGDRQVKKGDTITLTVKDVDPDSGEVEAVCNYEDKPKRSGMNEAIDAMPDEEG